MSNIEIERTPGFSGADGNISYNSANEAFNAYLNATGQKRTKETKKQFKQWLSKAKETGKLDQVLAGGKNRIAQEVEAQKAKAMEAVQSQANNSNADAGTATKTTEPEQKPMKIMGMPPIVAVGVIVAVVGLASWGIYTLVKKNKAKTA